MKQLLLLSLAFLCFSTTVKAQKLKKVKQQTADGLHTEIFTIDKNSGLKHGEYKKIVDKYETVEIGNYIQGKKHGEWAFLKDGFKVVAIFENGQSNNYYYIYSGGFSSNEIASEGEMINNQKVGVWKFYGFKNKIHSIYDFTNNKLLKLDDKSVKDREIDYYDNGVLKTALADNKAFTIGGEIHLLKTIAMSLRYPAVAKKYNIEGRVILTAVVDIDGTISKPKIKSSPDESLSDEVLRIYNKNISKLNWLPANVNGIAVKSIVEIPVRFKLE